jgi:hypothetical protein
MATGSPIRKSRSLKAHSTRVLFEALERRELMAVSFNPSVSYAVAGNPMAADHDLPFFLLAEDADHDRDVDANDLGVLACNWQRSPRTFAQGDFDYNGAVNVNDLGILASHWQQTLVPPSVPSAVSGARNLTGSLREPLLPAPG